MTYNDHGSLMALGVSLPVLGTIALAMRAISHRRCDSKLRIDDILILPAYVLNCFMGIAIAVVTSRHIIGSSSYPKMSTSEYTLINKFEYGCWIVYPLALGFTKLSILFFFRRIFRGVALRTPFDYVNWGLIILTALWMTAFLITAIFICGSHPDWDWTTIFWTHHKCINSYIMFLACSSTSTFLDLAIVIEPIVMISKLQLNRTKKIQAALIFLLSMFAVIAGVMRLTFFIQLDIGGRQKEIYHLVGLTYNIFNDLEPIVSIGIFWSYMEIGVAFIIACLLTSAKLFDISPVLYKVRSFASTFRSRSDGSVRSGSTSYSGGPDSEKMSYQSSTPSSRNPRKVTTIVQSYDEDTELPPSVASSAEHV